MRPPGPARVALVTGAAGGIGSAIVAQLARDGFSVVAADRAGRFETTGSIVDLVVDVRDAAACEHLVRAAGERGRLAAVVHAAGITRDAVLWKLQPADWHDVIETNLTSAFHLCRHAVPLMRAGGGGAIVLVSSINGERGKVGQTAYAASKAGLHGFGKSLARETGRFGIRVNVVAPGLVDTPMTAALPDAVRQAAVDESCLGRAGEPGDVAAAVSFLCSPAARHVTGQVLRVDGGQYT